jgi:K+-sensing histidine kinase KdpD
LDLLGVMSHEFKTPPKSHRGYAGMLKEGCLGAISEEQQRALERILTSADDLFALVMGLLRAAGLEANGVQLKREAVAVSSYSRSSRRLFACRPTEN